MPDAKAVFTPGLWQKYAASGCYWLATDADDDGFGRVVAKGLTNADADRILACVNACAGIPTQDLEAGMVGRLYGNALKYADLIMNSEATPATER